MNFFFMEITAFSGNITPSLEIVSLKKVVIVKKKSSPFLMPPVVPIAINMNRFMWLVCREICLAVVLGRQKSLANTALDESKK